MHDVVNLETDTYNSHENTMKSGQLIEYDMRKTALHKDHGEIEGGRLVPHLFSFFKKVLQDVKGTGQYPSLNIFW